VDPFLKWAGGKRWLVSRISKSIPHHRVYFEPLVGGGSLFFALQPRQAVLADVNKDLINCYRRVRRECSDVIAVLEELSPGKRKYYEVRSKFAEERDLVKRAAYFIFLNRLSWNGLYRVNQRGLFNVPVRNAARRQRVFDEEELRRASALLKKAKLLCCDFEEAVREARSNDFVYFDPPYITTHLTNGFVKYNSRLFSNADELRLASVAARLFRRGVNVVVSNAAHSLIREQYDGAFQVRTVSRASRIAADSRNRGLVKELVISSFPLVIPEG
jgi:DNA adenine methylase